MHAPLTLDPRDDLTHSKHVHEDILWVLQFTHMPYCMGLGAPWVYMSQHWHFGPFFHFLCAPRIEMFKVLFLFFEPELLLLKGLKASGCFHAKVQTHLPWELEIQFLQLPRLGRLTMFWTTMVPNSFSPSFQPRACVRLVSKVKCDLESLHEPTSNGLCHHV